jgi:hypothetical protein
MQEDLNPLVEVPIPTTNLNKVMHVVWWLFASNGKKVKVDLYFTKLHDMI